MFSRKGGCFEGIKKIGVRIDSGAWYLWKLFHNKNQINIIFHIHILCIICNNNQQCIRLDFLYYNNLNKV